MRVRRMTKDEGTIWQIAQYPNFSVTGNIEGMKNKYYGKDALLVRCGAWIYHVPPKVYYAAH